VLQTAVSVGHFFLTVLIGMGNDFRVMNYAWGVLRNFFAEHTTARCSAHSYNAYQCHFR
jgi:hypothetical protein